jgi:methylglutamate dehydrogenase subunit D
MLEVHSPVAHADLISIHGVTLSEAQGFTLTQIAGDEKALKKVLGKLPKEIGHALELNGRTMLRIGPKQVWVLGETLKESEGVYITPLSSGRTRFLIEGLRARDVLSACALIDFTTDQFRPGQFVLTGIHHTPVTIHCIGENSFHIYALRTFALNVWEWLCDITEGLDHA